MKTLFFFFFEEPDIAYSSCIEKMSPITLVNRQLKIKNHQLIYENYVNLLFPSIITTKNCNNYIIIHINLYEIPGQKFVYRKI